LSLLGGIVDSVSKAAGDLVGSAASIGAGVLGLGGGGGELTADSTLNNSNTVNVDTQPIADAIKSQGSGFNDALMLQSSSAAKVGAMQAAGSSTIGASINSAGGKLAAAAVFVGVLYVATLSKKRGSR